MLTFSGISKYPGASSSSSLAESSSQPLEKELVPISLKQLAKDFREKLPDDVKEKIIPREELVEDIVVFRRPTTPKNIGTQLTRLRFLEHHPPQTDERNYALLEYSLRKNYPPLFKALLKSMQAPDIPRLLRAAVQARNDRAFNALLSKVRGPLPRESLDETLQCLADYGQPEKQEQLLATQPENILPPERIEELQRVARAQAEQIRQVARIPQHRAMAQLFEEVESRNPEDPESFRRIIALLQRPDLNVRKRKRDENNEQYGILSAAIYAQDMPVVKALLADPRIQVNIGKTNKPLHVAIGTDKRLVETVLEMPEVDVNLCNEQKEAPLHVAVGNGCEETLTPLLKARGIDVNVQDDEGYTPLHWAVMVGNSSMVRMLLREAKGVDVNHPTHFQNSPLHTAVIFNQPEMLKILLQHPEIDVHSVNREGFTPLALANQYKLPELVELLRSHDAIE